MEIENIKEKRDQFLIDMLEGENIKKRKEARLNYLLYQRILMENNRRVKNDKRQK